MRNITDIEITRTEFLSLPLNLQVQFLMKPCMRRVWHAYLNWREAQRLMPLRNMLKGVHHGERVPDTAGEEMDRSGS